MSQDIEHNGEDEEGLPLPQETDGPSLFGDAPPPPPKETPKHPPEKVTTATPPQEEAATPVQDKTYQVLARKYRPRRFKDLIGQDAMVQTLRNSFALGRVAHAFMLTGIRGVGKTTTARIIARALNCTGREDPKDVEPCGHCENCIAILEGRHPDVIEMDAASKTGVDDVREIIESAQFRPLLGRKKVFIIDEVHMLSRNAFNSLLKTLEEPPEHVVFIFATTELRKVPITVISRCQRFDLLRVPQPLLVEFFDKIARKENVSISKDALMLLALAAEGSVRDGLSLLDQAIVQHDVSASSSEIDAASVRRMLGVADGRVIADILQASLKGQPKEVLSLMDKAWSQGVDCALVIKDMLGLLHDISRYRAVGSLHDIDLLSAVDPKCIEAFGKAYNLPILMRAWQLLVKGLGEIELAPDRRSAADMVMLRLCYVANLPTPSQAIAHVMGKQPPKTAPATPPSSPPPQEPSQKKELPIKQPADTEESSAGAKKKITINNWRDVVALARDHRQVGLHAELKNAVHLVSFAPGEIVIRPDKTVGRGICQRLKQFLDHVDTRPWKISESEALGEATLDQQGQAVKKKQYDAVGQDPFVQSVLAAFPGSKFVGVHNPALDYYGLPKHNDT